MGDAIAGVKDDSGGAAGGVEGQNGLDGHVHGRHVKGLKHDLRHLLAVGLGVEWRLRQQHRVLLGRHAQLIVEGVVPDLLHVVPAQQMVRSCQGPVQPILHSGTNMMQGYIWPSAQLLAYCVSVTHALVWCTGTFKVSTKLD